MTNFYFFDTTDGTSEIIQAICVETAWELLCDIYGTEYVEDNIIQVEMFQEKILDFFLLFNYNIIRKEERNMTELQQKLESLKKSGIEYSTTHFGDFTFVHQYFDEVIHTSTFNEKGEWLQLWESEEDYEGNILF